MDYEEMNLQAIDNLAPQSPDRQPVRLTVKKVKDYPTQKVIRVLHDLQKAPGDEFDITLCFQWQASEEEPNDFDGVNLMCFRHPISRLVYRAVVPWKPAQPKVRAQGVIEQEPELKDEKRKRLEHGSEEYCFEIDNPRPLAYLIYLMP